MKKSMKRMVTLLMVVLLMAAFALPVMAAQMDTKHMVVGKSDREMSATPYVSSDPDVVRVEHSGGNIYTIVAVSKGKAILTGGSWMGAAKPDCEITVHSSGVGSVIGDMADVSMALVIIMALMILLLLLEIVYIFIAAPKCGMSRLWALVPLFSHFFGLIAFIVVRTNRKTQVSPANTFACPTCQAVHPYGTAVCSVCGKKFY